MSEQKVSSVLSETDLNEILRLTQYNESSKETSVSKLVIAILHIMEEGKYLDEETLVMEVTTNNNNYVIALQKLTDNPTTLH